MKVVEPDYDYDSDTLRQIKSHMTDMTLNVTDPILDSLWEYWLRNFHFQEWCSTSYIDYRWNGTWEEPFIEYEYIREFIKWLEDIDVDDVPKLLQEE